MKNPINILIITPYPVSPPLSGAQARVFHLASHAASIEFKCTIITPFGKKQPWIKKIGENLTIQTLPYIFLHTHLFPATMLPFMYLTSYHPGYSKIVSRYIDQFDIFQFEHASLANLIDVIPANRHIIYNAHNVEHDYVESECAYKSIRTLVTSRIQKLESKLIRRSDKIFVCSHLDQRRFINLYGAQEDKMLLIANGIKDDELKKTSDSEKPPNFQGIKRYEARVLFSGSDAPHNRKAVDFIVSVLAQELPQHAFIIKGSCGRCISKSIDNIFIDSSDGDISYCASLSTVAINPVTVGGGTSLKLLEYLRLGLPVVTTPFGMRGYDHLSDYITLGQLSDFPRLLQSTYKLSPNYKEALQPYRWSNIAAKIRDAYKSFYE